uniref:Beta-mannosidase n=2 Tax=environmental samples TaxID=48479 RepID=G9IS17_9BACT|nr:GHF2 protein [uncultured bacterium A2_10]AEW47947.1 GHF2 protein [uncultured bacterium B2_18]
MKKIFIKSLILISLFFIIADASATDKLKIDSGWEFRQKNLGDWMPAKVPGVVQTDLLINKKIKDPFYGDNYLSIQWIDKLDWEYRTVFDAPDAEKNSNARLVFEGLDCYATVTLNGKQILVTDNMFRPWTANVKEIIKPKGNVLLVTFKSPTQQGLQQLSDFGLRLHGYNEHGVTGGIGENEIRFFQRKPGYQYGWDLTPRIITVGIWRPVILESWNEGHIEDLYAYTESLEKDYSKASIGTRVTASVDTAGDYTIGISFGDDKIKEVQKTLKSGENVIEESFTVNKPELWWPNGAGKPHLYDVRVTLTRNGKEIDSYSRKMGIRTTSLKRVDDADGKGTSFGIEINYKPVFCKGSSYVPSEVLLGREDPGIFEHIVKSVADVNMNMLRIWGGGIYESDHFYDLCDKYGIMVWHDFMFACGMYPDTKEFYDNVEMEAKQNMVRLRNHPSIVLWCGNNEVEVPWNPYGSTWEKSKWQHFYNKGEVARLTKGMEDLFYDQLDRYVKETYSDNMPYWPSSPLPGYKMAVESPFNQGDHHYWKIWHARHPVDNFNTNVGRFMSEYGVIGLPEIASMKNYTPEKDFWLNSPTMEIHNGSAKGNDVVMKYVSDRFKVPESFENKVYVSQIMQGEAMVIAMEAHRRNMPWCQGSLIWQINDCWPSNTWSGIDFYGYWKAMHYDMRQACAPVLVAPYIHGDTLDVFVVSDLYKHVKGTLKITLMDFAGRKLKSDSKKISISPMTSKKVIATSVKSFLNGANKATNLLLCEFTSSNMNASNILYFDLTKNLQLPKPNIRFDVKGFEGDEAIISVSTDNLAKNIMIKYKGEAGRFSDNFFDLLPGQSRDVKIMAKGTTAEIIDDLTYITMDQM